MPPPDFSAVDSRDKAESLTLTGELEQLLLCPTEFGGTNSPGNILYVPRGFAAEKARIDLQIIAPLIREGKLSRYSARPEYQGSSFVPAAIHIVASEPGSFAATIAVWGDALDSQRG